MAGTIFLAALLALLAWPGADAYPRFWYDSDYLISYGYGPADGYDWSVFPERNCFNYPTKSYSGFYPAHNTPYTDSSIALAFTSSDGSAVTSLCPGATHTVTLSFPTKRLALLTTNPAVTFTSPEPTPSCPGRLDLGGSAEDGEDTSFSGTFNVPCDAAGSTVVFAVTSAGSSPFTAKRWAQNQASLTVADATSAQCAAVSTACAPAAVEPSPAAEPSPSPASEPSPEPAPEPAPSPSPEPTPSPAAEPKPEPAPSSNPSATPSPSTASKPSPSTNSKPAPAPDAGKPARVVTRRHPPPTRRPPPRRG